MNHILRDDRAFSAKWTRLAAWLVLALGLLTPGAYAATTPALDPALLGAIKSDTQEGVTVRTSVPDAKQVEAIFGVPVIEKGIQPVWVEITNGGSEPLWYMPITTDETYFAPLEVAYRFHDDLDGAVNTAREARFNSLRMDLVVPPGKTVSGFVFTHLETGLKFLTFGMLRGDDELEFHFTVPVAGPPYAVQRVDFDKIYPPDAIKAVDLVGLRAAIEALPCCTTDAKATKNGDPLNLVIVGDGLASIFPFVSRGWRLTEPLDIHSAVDTTKSFLIGTHYATSPVSPLYLFGRQQDLALEKARNTINERNHLRLWRAPLSFEGHDVWVGQISRDIGVELTDTSWYLTTHKVDPDVDFDRDYLLQDLLLSGSVQRFGFASGVGVSPAAHPRVNLTDDPYVTDGLRLVVLLGVDDDVTDAVDALAWEAMPADVE
ncbi:LssY C-terminal domain-containing protein [Kaistia dalseonensis]|uniref:LssY-like C-terminal domain-containing protein n=1 Tax=Kaistia dalseonensis TaxID=410840 RepID=A0ABU0HDL6_9HYPH|nr:LssY C-terminal domain-containing protein [Kaistia dalseonensis]MCX5497778.1 LssY C-terminal domain-containing protein [Kaistia dalseonensis]MDQ0440422.1 hypothetical protein [Kaistia dalseonensis]